MRRLLVVPALTAVLAVGLAGCGDGDDDTAADAPTTTTTTEASGSSTSEPGGSSTTTADGSTTTAEGGSTTVPPGDLPGEPIDIYPYEGAALAVVGVAAADTLNVRSGPGTDFDVVTELEPLAEGISATGQNRILDDDSFWAEVEADGSTGWVNGLYVAEPGATADVTGEVGDVSAETMEAVAQAVAAGRVVAGEGPTPTVTIVAGPDAGSEGEVTVDVIGLADDAQKGERLHIVASLATGGEGFTVTAVEATALCARGVSDGLCT